jgi:arylsulfatase A-like enzyme/Flp pilus assembly protein TadD
MATSARIVAACLGLIASLSGCDRIEHHPLAKAPNVLLVTIDTLRADHVGSYGAPEVSTPTLDALAREGVRFQLAISASPLTLPSHASILTGLYPPAHGVRHNGLFRLEARFDTLAERLHSAGYATGAVMGSVVLARRYGLDQGFERYDDEVSPHAAVPGGYLERDADAVTDRALEWLSTARRPFFLWTHYYDPHFEYRPPAPYADRFRERPYAGEIAFVDASLARLLAGLRESKLLDDTLIVATSDHGESLGEHGEVTHGYGLYDATLVVPLLLRGPGIPRGRVIEEPVRTVDIAPTVLRRAGLEPSHLGDGRDLAPLWHPEPPRSPRWAYAETLATRFDHGWSPLFAVRSPKHLYVRAPRAELYALEQDPSQQRNLVEQAPSVAASVVTELDARIQQVLEREHHAVSVDLDASTRRRLAALGYAIPENTPPESNADPKDGLPWLARFYAAQQSFAEGDLERALALGGEVVAAAPGSAEAHTLLARAWTLRGRLERALEQAETAVRLVPRSAQYRALLGNAKLTAGDFEGAAADYRVAFELDPTHPLAHCGLMWVNASQGRLPDALQHERIALAQDASNPELREWIGALWERAGRFDRAQKAYASALRLDPDSPSLHMALAIQLARAGREAESERHLAKAGVQADAPHFRNRLAIAYATAGDAGRAEAIFREVVANHPEYPTAERNLAALLRQTRSHREASSPKGEAE